MDNAISEHRGETTRLGSFDVLRKLARGGMAEIFLARASGPSGFEKLVVLKKILPKYADKPRYVQLFLEEAKLAASLDHPSIAQVYDVGVADGSYFFTMEYLHGQDVRSILHRSWRTGERFPIEHAVQVASHVAAALHFAHEKQRGDGTLLGIVHRDVSPSNIIVTYDGTTKLLDFGVAKTAASTVKTRTGTLKGKISYMSPEQARGATIDRRSDIFSLGIVLWEMVTTQRLYRAENDLATLQLIITQPPRPPSSVRADCPPELERIVLRALAQNPEARYATAAQLAVELDELAREHKLEQSPGALAATLGDLFGPELAVWREARAAGVPLADHLHAVGDTTTPVSESDFVDPDDGLGGDADDDVDDVGDVDDDDLTEHAAPIIDPLSPLASEPAVPEPIVLRSSPPTNPRTTPSAPLPVASDTAPSTVTEPGPEEAAAITAVPDAQASDRPFAASPPLGVPRGIVGGLRTSTAPFSAPPWQSGQSSPPDRIPRPWSAAPLPAADPVLFERQRRVAGYLAAAWVGVVVLLALLVGTC